MTFDPAALRRTAEAFLSEDPDPETRAELRRLLEEGDDDELADRFRGPLRFGTAGLRGKLGAGLHRMNRAVVLRTVAGVCAHLAAEVPDAQARGVCIGFDGRHKSRVMAEDAAAVVRGAGFRAFLFDAPVPTPLLAFAVLDRGAAAGLMVTASHNPPEYNGLKVFAGDGAQIVEPTDRAIAEAIDRAPPASRVPRVEADAAGQATLQRLGEAVVERYLDAVAPARAEGAVAEPTLLIAYTALHGVGEPLARRALARAGFTHVVSVLEQSTPDPDFPTVTFPNPEEPEALERVLGLAERERAELVLANDPDADRLAAAARHDGALRVLGGNEIGCLLAHYLLERDGGGPDAVLISTVVSSPMLGDIARAHGARWAQTLTGHKWIHREAMRQEAQGRRFVFGYEEALGFAPGTAVRDKDGISAAVLLAEAARWCKRRGHTLVDELALMAERYGRYESLQRAEVHEGPEGEAHIAASLHRARAAPPRSLGGCPVRAVVDLAEGVRRTAEGQVEPMELPKSDVLSYELEGGHRAMLRPSGTEPKLKLYVDVRVAPGAGSGGAARALAERVLADLTALLQAP